MTRRPALRLVSPEEAAATLPPSPVEEAKALATFTSWKFDVLETVNADPLTDVYCVVFIEAILHFVNAKTRTAYLSADTAKVRAKLTKTTLIKTRRKLVRLKYIVPVGRTDKGVTVYRIENPRRQVIVDHMFEASEKLREMAAERRAEERRLGWRGAPRVPPETAEGCASDTRRGAPRVPKHLEQHLESYLYEGGRSPKGDPFGAVSAAEAYVSEIRARSRSEFAEKTPGISKRPREKSNLASGKQGQTP